MARFGTFDDMVAFLEANPPINRMDFLRNVRFATLDNWGPTVDDHDMTRAIACAMAWRWIPRTKSCPVCQQAFHLGSVTQHATGRQTVVWRGASPEAQKKGRVRKCWCYGRRRPVGGDSILEKIFMRNWLDFLDVAVMWACDYPQSTMNLELKNGGHQTVDRWDRTLQGLAAEKMGRPGVVEIGGFGKVVECDESLLNKTKRATLMAPASRTQRWIWGAVEEGNSGRFTFKALEHPDDAIQGRPRGVQELLLAVMSSGIREGTHVVHDGWRATVALPWEELGMTNTVVRHNQGEVVAYDAMAPFPEELCFFTTNHVEAKWSSLKRRMRKRCGGKMPGVESWELYIREYQWRKWYGGPTTPLLIDDVRDHYQPAQERKLEEELADARRWMVIELESSNDEDMGPLPRPAIELLDSSEEEEEEEVEVEAAEPSNDEDIGPPPRQVIELLDSSQEEEEEEEEAEAAEVEGVEAEHDDDDQGPQPMEIDIV